MTLMMRERQNRTLAHNRMRVRARYQGTSFMSTMLPRFDDFAVPDRSSLAKSLISLNPFINIMVLIGHSLCQMPKNADFDPPRQNFRRGANANDLITRPRPPDPSNRC